jgi:hypothetical protein
MASENLKIDENGRNVTGGITNDASEFIKNLRVNPITGRVLVDAVVGSTNTSIGSTIPGGTAGSILFLGLGSTLAQDNANLFYDDTNNWVGFGTNTPSATLDLVGTFQYVDGNQQAGYILTSDGLGNATWQIAVASSGITSINADTTTAQTLTDAVGGYIDITDDMAGGHTFGIDITGLTGDATFITDIIDIINNGGGSVQIDLATQVTGVLPLANGGTASALTDPNYDAIMGWDDTDNSVSFWNIGTNLSYDHATHTLNASAGAGGYATIQDNGTPVAQETTLNFVDYFTVTDDGGSSRTNVSIDVTALAGDATFLSTLESGLDLANISGQIDLTTQVSGVLPLANGGTGANLSDPGANTLLGWDDTDNAVDFFTIGTGLAYNHATHTLTASGSIGSAVNADETISGSIVTPLNIADNSWTNTNPSYNSNGGYVAIGIQYKSSVPSGYSTAGWTTLKYNIDIQAPGKKVKLRWQMMRSGTSSTDYVVVGFANTMTVPYRTNTTDNAITIVANNTTAYGVTIDASTNTNTDLVVTQGNANPHIYEIVWNPGTDVTFWVDGVLAATHTTSIPTGNVSPFVWITANGTADGYVTGLVLSQEL